MPAEFLNKSKEQLMSRARGALEYLNSATLVGYDDLGTKLSPYAGSNMNSLWATIVLGEWLQNLEAEAHGLD